MTKERIRELVHGCVFNVVDLQNINDQTRLMVDLGFDSLDAVEMVMLIEDAFKIHIPDEAVEVMQTVGDVVDYVENRLKDKEAAAAYNPEQGMF